MIYLSVILAVLSIVTAGLITRPMWRRTKVYISGPITGVKDYQDRFKKAAEKLSAAGFKPVNPARKEVSGWTWADYMRRDIRLLTQCDAIYLLDGWEKSQGAGTERYIAEKIELDIFLDTSGKTKGGYRWI